MIRDYLEKVFNGAFESNLRILEERWKRPNRRQLPTVKVRGRKYHYEQCNEGEMYSYILHGRNGARYGLVGKESFCTVNMKSKRVVEKIGKFRVTESGLEWIRPANVKDTVIPEFKNEYESAYKKSIDDKSTQLVQEAFKRTETIRKLLKETFGLFEAEDGSADNLEDVVKHEVEKNAISQEDAEKIKTLINKWQHEMPGKDISSDIIKGHITDSNPDYNLESIEGVINHFVHVANRDKPQAISTNNTNIEKELNQKSQHDTTSEITPEEETTKHIEVAVKKSSGNEKELLEKTLLALRNATTDKEREEILKNMSKQVKENDSSQFPLMDKIFKNYDKKTENKGLQMLKTIATWAGGTVLAMLAKDNMEIAALLGGAAALTKSLSDIAFKKPEDYKTADELNTAIDNARDKILLGYKKYRESLSLENEQIKKSIIKYDPSDDQLSKLASGITPDDKDELTLLKLFNIKKNIFDGITKVAAVLENGKKLDVDTLEKATGVQVEFLRQWKEHVIKHKPEIARNLKIQEPTNDNKKI